MSAPDTSLPTPQRAGLSGRIRIWLLALGVGHAIGAAGLAAQAGATLAAVVTVALGALLLTFLVATVVASRTPRLGERFDWETFEQEFRAYVGELG